MERRLEASGAVDNDRGLGERMVALTKLLERRFTRTTLASSVAASELTRHFFGEHTTEDLKRRLVKTLVDMCEQDDFVRGAGRHRAAIKRIDALMARLEKQQKRARRRK